MTANYSLYCIMDGSICDPDIMIHRAARLVDSGVSCIQLRMKNATSERMIDTGKKLLEILKPKNIPLIINDRVEVAKKVNAAGVHIGQQDIAYVEAREYLGDEKIIGLSIENNAHAQKCRHLDVDYFGVGPVYRTSTKRDAAPPLGLQQLKEICDVLPKPLVAIGGINEKNVLAVLKTGVAGIAVASAILAAPDPELTATHLARLISDHRQQQQRNRHPPHAKD